MQVQHHPASIWLRNQRTPGHDPLAAQHHCINVAHMVIPFQLHKARPCQAKEPNVNFDRPAPRTWWFFSMITICSSKYFVKSSSFSGTKFSQGPVCNSSRQELLHFKVATRAARVVAVPNAGVAYSNQVMVAIGKATDLNF